MKRFKFRLEKVLQYRTLIKDEKLRELMLRNYELKQAEAELEELEEAFLRNELEQQKILRAEDLFLRGAYALRLKDRIVAQRLAIIEADKKVQEAMEAYVEASKDQKALAMLKERKRNEYLEWVDKELGKDLDEISVQRVGYMRGKRLEIELEDK
jgi:flagellar protein FliJ